MNMHADGINEMPADVLTQPSKSVSPKQPTEDVFHGFSDLSFIDFTCTKFPAIAAVSRVSAPAIASPTQSLFPVWASPWVCCVCV